MGFGLLSKYRKQIMGFSALWIIMFHYWRFLSFGNLVFVENFIKCTGFCGVDIFLLVSGYGLYYSMEKSQDILLFYKKRFEKLWFPTIVIGIVFAVTNHWGIVEFIKNISGYRFFTENIYTFLWFIYAIACLYIFFPFYYRLFRRMPNKLIFTFVVFCLWLAVSLLVKDSLRYDLWGATNRIPVFLLGVLYGYLSKRENDRITLLGWCLLGIVLIVGLILSYYTNQEGMYFLVPISNCCIPNLLIASSLPLFFAKMLDFLSSKSLNTVLSAAGVVSLELYCVQDIVNIAAQTWLRPDISDLMWDIAIFGGCAVFAAAIHYLYELLKKFFWKIKNGGQYV